MRLLICAIALVAIALAAWDKGTYELSRSYPSNCGKLAVVAAEPINAYVHKDDKYPKHVDRLVCSDGTIAITKD